MCIIQTASRIWRRQAPTPRVGHRPWKIKIGCSASPYEVEQKIGAGVHRAERLGCIGGRPPCSQQKSFDKGSGIRRTARSHRQPNEIRDFIRLKESFTLLAPNEDWRTYRPTSRPFARRARSAVLVSPPIMVGLRTAGLRGSSRHRKAPVRQPHDAGRRAFRHHAGICVATEHGRRSALPCAFL